MIFKESLFVYIIFIAAWTQNKIKWILASASNASSSEDVCNASCSLVYDPVCGLVRTSDNISSLEPYHNACHLQQIKCKMDSLPVIEQVPHEKCGIKRPNALIYRNSGRRVHDFGIVGAHQPCNHTCPTYCLDTYDPACASVWNPNGTNAFYKPMVNHCHIDLFSCSMGLNVTIEPLSTCFDNPSSLMFMSQVAGMKSLGLLDEGPSETAKQLRSGRGKRSIVRSWDDGLYPRRPFMKTLERLLSEYSDHIQINKKILN